MKKSDSLSILLTGQYTRAIRGFRPGVATTREALSVTPEKLLSMSEGLVVLDEVIPDSIACWHWLCRERWQVSAAYSAQPTWALRIRIVAPVWNWPQSLLRLLAAQV